MFLLYACSIRCVHIGFMWVRERETVTKVRITLEMSSVAILVTCKSYSVVKLTTGLPGSFFSVTFVL
jgi:hypothetical protein